MNEIAQLESGSSVESGFAGLGLSGELVGAVEGEGYSVPTPIQAKAIPAILEGRDVLGCAQTGTGKTAAFALPILQRLAKHAAEGRRVLRALILSPTRELAAQIGQSFRDYGKNYRIRSGVVFGGVGERPQIEALRGGADLVIATPGRLIDLIERGHADLSKVEVLVLDEADQLLDMGFIPAIRRIVARLPKARQNLLFSATMPAEIRQLAGEILRQPVSIAVTPVSATADRIEQSVYHVEKAAKPGLLAHVIKTEGITRGLVFVRTKHGADRVARKLAACGIAAQAIHGNKSQGQRERAIKAFKSQSPPVLVATDIAARGLDIDEVSHVVNYDLPNVPETYVHRIGRTARAGASGVAISFCDREERVFLRDIERLTRQKIEVREDQPAGAQEERPVRREPERPQAQHQPRREGTRQQPGRPAPQRRDGRRPGGGSHGTQHSQPQNGQARGNQEQRRGGHFRSDQPMAAPDAMPEHGYRRPVGKKRPHRKGQRRFVGAR